AAALPGATVQAPCDSVFVSSAIPLEENSVQFRQQDAQELHPSIRPRSGRGGQFPHNVQLVERRRPTEAKSGMCGRPPSLAIIPRPEDAQGRGLLAAAAK